MSKKQNKKPKNLESNLGPFWENPPQRPFTFKHTMSETTTLPPNTLPPSTKTARSPMVTCGSAYVRPQAQPLSQAPGQGTPKGPPQLPPHQ